MRLGTLVRWFGRLLGRRSFWWMMSGSRRYAIEGPRGLAIQHREEICFSSVERVGGGYGRCWGARWGRVS